MQQFNLSQSLSLIDNYPITNSIFSESPFFGYGDGKDELRDGNMLSAFDNQPFDMVYSTPPSSPEKQMNKDNSKDVQVNVNNFPKNDNIDKNEQLNNNCISINPYIPLTSIPGNLMSNDPYNISTSILNNGIILPRTSIIAVDPLIYMQILNSYRNNNIFSDLYPQLYSSMIYQQLLGQQITEQVSQQTNDTILENPNPKKRKSTSNKRPQRRVRPKVVPEKGAIQCIGMNRKKIKDVEMQLLWNTLDPDQNIVQNIST